MNPYTQAIILSASTVRMLPHIGLYLLKRRQIDADLEKYSPAGRVILEVGHTVILDVARSKERIKICLR